ncbi:MAG: M48 family metallopeptidase, partial [Thermodesulfobacteriota bacterium]
MKGPGFIPRLATVVCLILGVVAAFLPAAPASAMTYEEERKLGRSILAYFQEHVEFVDDPAVTAYVNGLGRKILARLGPQPFEYRFFVIKSEAINAFAAPAGYVFLNSGTLVQLQTEGQLAAILSHEIAHVTGRHMARRIENNKKLNWATVAGILAGTLLGGAPGAAVAMGSVGANMSAQLAFSREDEREADRKGLEYLQAAGYSPQDMAGAFEIMFQSSYHQPQDIPSYFTTHPGLGERISAIRASAGEG